MDSLRQLFLFLAGLLVLVWMVGACLGLWMDLAPRLVEAWNARKARKAYRQAETPPRG